MERLPTTPYARFPEKGPSSYVVPGVSPRSTDDFGDRLALLPRWEDIVRGTEARLIKPV
jgi:hypothetical protein